RFKLVALVAVLLAAVALFLLLFLPRRLYASAERWMERHALGIAVVLASASAPGLEFDDSASVTELLGSLKANPDVIYAVVRRHDGTLLGAFQAERAPGPLGGQQPSCGEPPQV